MTSFGTQRHELLAHVPRDPAAFVDPTGHRQDPATDSQLPVGASLACSQLSIPGKFSHELGDIRPSLTQCEVHLQLQGDMYHLQPLRASRVVGHGVDWSRMSAVCSSLIGFRRALEQVHCSD